MKKSNNISKFILLAFLFAANYAFAQAPEGYYSNADGKKGSALKTALGEIISSGFNTISYDGLWAAYKTTDLRPDGKIWDMYSNCTNFDPTEVILATIMVKEMYITASIRSLKAGSTKANRCTPTSFMLCLQTDM